MNDGLPANKKEGGHQDENDTCQYEELPPILSTSLGIVYLSDKKRDENRGLSCDMVTSPTNENNASCSNSNDGLESVHERCESHHNDPISEEIESPCDPLHMGACEDSFGAISLNPLVNFRRNNASHKFVT